ncbi:cytochrome oxidase c assembly-domain-containing protein [Amylocarpus encephaloides]|uniref:Cytochrome oxidase c assembly-domain-containing protein n=1 Tax=Amylocarpus encephaloides TaxID=45428 RepID=A0A9P7YHG1_9HELO|nr:cytochrome oxidase c assembly-domain-containing protein [Amylocarpus encephaloides]
MPRSATDATRFTSTMPHASAKQSPPKSQPPKGSQTGPPGETPLEKVRRLRAAADRAKLADVSTLDKIIVRGRVWADRAHRFTTLTLIAATFVAGGVTVYAFGDMMIYNRRKRAEFFAQQKAMHARAIETATKAIDSGTATQSQLDFMQREAEHDAQVAAAKAAKAAKRGIFGSAKDWLFSDLKKEEEGNDVGTSERRFGYEGSNEEDDSLGVRESDIVRAIEDKKLGLAAKAKKAFEEEKERERKGGPLDRLGTEPNPPADEDEKPKSRGWTSFMVRR